MNVEDQARQQGAEYVANALMRAARLLDEGSLAMPEGYHQYWWQVDAACLRIMSKELLIYHAKKVAFGDQT